MSDSEGTEAAAPDAPERAVVALVAPREGVPPVVATPAALAQTAAALASGSGPVAVDAERASGYRYGQRAYLVQLRRAGSGTHLVDPIAVPDLGVLAEALAGTEWVLHAASQDLPCLREIGLGAARVVAQKIHPIKVPQPEPILDILEKLQEVLKGTPPPWLRKALEKDRGVAHDFEDDEVNS